MNISDEAVEAAVEAHRECTMRAALEAAAPHIRAQVLEEMAAAARNDMALGQRLYVARWIRARAEMSQTPHGLEPREYMGPCECKHFGEHDTNPPCAKVRWDNAQ